MIAAWILVALLVYLGLGAFVESGFRPARRARHAPPVQQVRDQQLDIGPALERRSR